MTPEENRFRERRSAFTDDDAETPAPPASEAGPSEVEPSEAGPSEAGPEPAAEAPVGERPTRPDADAATAGPATPAEPAGPATPAGRSEAEAGPADADALDLDHLDRMEIPDPSFLEIVQPLEIQALQFLGLAPLTESGETRVLPRWAKHVIDLLGLLEERTRGNLPEEERAYLEQVVSELRVRYMKVTS